MPTITNIDEVPDSKERQVLDLPYVDIQHDATAVFDDVEQGVVGKEDIWISAYHRGQTSVHGKALVEFQEGGGSTLTPREGVQVEKLSKTSFTVSVPALGIVGRAIQFPRQIIHPPYPKTSDLDAPLQINTISLNPKTPHIVLGGPDGYCAVLPTSVTANPEKDVVRLKGHVGDVRDVKWFPSGEVILTASSDLSVRIFGRDGINPRTFKGHTRAVTCTAIIGVGKTVLSGSKDGTLRLWDVGKGTEARQWVVEGKEGVEGVVLVEDEEGLKALGLTPGGQGTDAGQERAMLVQTQVGVWVQPWDGEGWMMRCRPGQQVGSVAYEPRSGVVAIGHTSGVVELRQITSLSREAAPASTSPTRIRRNESPIYSLAFAPSQTDELELYVGTAAGLPCRLGVKPTEDGYDVRVVDELAGWDAVGVECFAVGKDGVWSGGGEGGLRRYTR
ncbi:hypothetical protein IAT38_000343 [Cryptococcus sp. DSM 104549]